MAKSRQTLISEVGTAMQRYQRSVQAFDDAVGRKLGLGPTDLRCLDWLTDGPKTAGQLTTATGLKPAAVTALLDRLTDKGLIERVRDQADRRQVMVQMTQKGKKQASSLYGPLVEEGQRLMTKLNTHDLALLRDYLVSSTALTDRHRDRIN